MRFSPATRSSSPLLLLLLSGSLQIQAQYFRQNLQSRGRAIDPGRRDEGSAAPAPEAASPRDPPVPGGEGRSEPETGDGGSASRDAGNENQDGAVKSSSEGEGGGGQSKDLYLISHEDFCVYGPREANTPIASAGLDVISWCTKEHGGKMIPPGTFEGVTYVKTPNYVQVSGTGDFTKLDIASSDMGGQLDSSEHTPEGAQLFLGDHQPASNWVTVIGADTFCVRACTGDPQYCPTKYDELGCWFITNNGVGWPGQFQDCEGEDGDIPGVVDGNTFTPGATPTPSTPAVSNCQGGGPIGGVAATGSSGNKSSDAHGSASGDVSGSSTSWVPVETCVPCAGAGAGGGSSSSSSHSGSASKTAVLSGTSEVGIDKIQSAPSDPSPTTSGEAAALGVSGAGAAGPTAPPKPSGDALVQKRQDKMSIQGAEADKPEAGHEDGEGEVGGHGEENKGGGETVTKGDQCCFTTWTAAGAAATGHSKSGDHTSLGGAAGAKSTGSTGSKSGAVTSASATGVAGSGGINKTANAANGTGNGTGDASDGAGSPRMEVFGIEGLARIWLGVMIGLIGAGWTLL